MVKQWLARVLKFEEPKPRTIYLEHDTPIGSSGSESYGGYPSEEYLWRLRGTERADIFDKMWRSDPQVKACLKAVTAPIKAAHFEVQAGPLSKLENEKQAEDDRALAAYILFEGMDDDCNWTQMLQEILTHIRHGHSAFELVDRPVVDHPMFGSFNGLRALSLRSARTIERWNLDKQTGYLKSLFQVVNGDLGRMVEIPSEFLVVFSLDREGSNYEGVSALRPCYGNYIRKGTYLKLNAIGVEKHAIPTPVVTVPSGKENTVEETLMKTALEHYMVHEKNYLMIPEGWLIDLKTNTYDPQKVETSIDNEDKRMVKAFLANFLELGLNGFGSQSLSFDLSDFFLSSLDEIAKGVCETISSRVLKRQIVMSRGERPDYPILRHSGISDRIGKEMAEVIKGWVDSGILTADDVLETHLRKRSALPPQDIATMRKKSQSPYTTSPTLAERVRMLHRG